jgi:putative transposase
LAHSFARITIHIVFATKRRQNLIPENKLQELFAYIIGIARDIGIPLLAVGGMPNHIHILIGLPSTMTYSDAISKIKSNSSRFMKTTNHNFGWQQGYGVRRQYVSGGYGCALHSESGGASQAAQFRGGVRFVVKEGRD